MDSNTITYCICKVGKRGVSLLIVAYLRGPGDGWHVCRSHGRTSFDSAPAHTPHRSRSSPLLGPHPPPVTQIKCYWSAEGKMETKLSFRLKWWFLVFTHTILFHIRSYFTDDVGFNFYWFHIGWNTFRNQIECITYGSASLRKKYDEETKHKQNKIFAFINVWRI